MLDPRDGDLLHEHVLSLSWNMCARCRLSKCDARLTLSARGKHFNGSFHQSTRVPPTHAALFATIYVLPLRPSLPFHLFHFLSVEHLFVSFSLSFFARARRALSLCCGIFSRSCFVSPRALSNIFSTESPGKSCRHQYGIIKMKHWTALMPLILYTHAEYFSRNHAVFVLNSRVQ